MLFELFFFTCFMLVFVLLRRQVDRGVFIEQAVLNLGELEMAIKSKPRSLDWMMDSCVFIQSKVINSLILEKIFNGLCPLIYLSKLRKKFSESLLRIRGQSKISQVLLCRLFLVGGFTILGRLVLCHFVASGFLNSWSRSLDSMAVCLAILIFYLSNIFFSSMMPLDWFCRESNLTACGEAYLAAFFGDFVEKDGSSLSQIWEVQKAHEMTSGSCFKSQRIEALDIWAQSLDRKFAEKQERIEDFYIVWEFLSGLAISGLLLLVPLLGCYKLVSRSI